MKHLTLGDMITLQYHLEFGDFIDDEDYYREITLHLDSCEICKKRYYHDENGNIKDRKDLLLDYVVNQTIDIVSIAIHDGIVEQEKFITHCLNEVRKRRLDKQMNECKLYGADEDVIIKMFKDRTGNNLLEILFRNEKI